VPSQSIFYGCGDNFDNEDMINVADLAVDAIYTASIFKMDNDGSVKWMYRIGGTNPVSGKKNQDRCYGITVDAKTEFVTALLQVKAKEIRSLTLSYGNFYDTVLLQLDPTGTFKYAVQITNRDLAIDMYSAD
jgi:hypothetical protein